MFRLLVLICCLQLWNCQETPGKYVPVYSNKVNWFKAHELCNHSGMILATVSSYDQHLQVIRSIHKNGNLLGLNNFWLGASNLGDLNSWTWQSIDIPLGYKNWAKDEPHSNLIGQEGCMVMGLDEFWYSTDCHSEYYFICERTYNSIESPEPVYI